MTIAAAPLKAPFPAFGGKSRIAGTVWPRLSTERYPARNYVEPFCFSAAMLLLRPDEPKIETINDLNAFVANFWRAIQADPEAVAAHADWPVNETDLHSRHAWLVRSADAAERLERVRTDPEYFDAKIAGWWCWGACMWIGSGWCDEQQIPHMADAGQGVLSQQIPHMADADAKRPQGVHKKPILTSDGGTGDKGVNSVANLQEQGELNSGRGMLPQKLPELNSAAGDAAAPFHRQPALGQAGWGVNALGDAELAGARGVLSQQVPELAGAAGRPQLADAYSRGRGVHGHDELTACAKRRQWLINWFIGLADRLRPVRVCCGHWSRVCDSDSTLTRLGTTAAFLDPPYRKTLADGSANRASHIYANDKTQDVGALVDEVQAWCLKWGSDKAIRIAVCGLEGEYPKLDDAGWEVLAWKSQGGYGNRNKDNANAARERIYFSPHCIAAEDEHPLFREAC